jgi:16S rRNA (uracil1498-N3)-methyltransferase
MALAFFYHEDLAEQKVQLSEDASKHLVQVLRMKNGDSILLTDGKGKKATSMIIDDNRKRCVVQLISVEQVPPPERKVAIAISLIKNNARFEWFLEKATEIGVSEIIPLTCERTEKDKFRFERLKAILVSAMLQSQQFWLPQLHEPLAYEELVKNYSAGHHKKFIAHCMESDKEKITFLKDQEKEGSSMMLIGPEGDFTKEEIELALEQNFKAVSLGNTRLRTETAGMVAAVLLCAE